MLSLYLFHLAWYMTTLHLPLPSPGSGCLPWFLYLAKWHPPSPNLYLPPKKATKKPWFLLGSLRNSSDLGIPNSSRQPCLPPTLTVLRSAGVKWTKTQLSRSRRRPWKWRSGVIGFGSVPLFSKIKVYRRLLTPILQRGKQEDLGK